MHLREDGTDGRMALPYEMKSESMQNPQRLEELLTVVETHQNTQDLLKWPWA